MMSWSKYSLWSKRNWWQKMCATFLRISFIEITGCTILLQVPSGSPPSYSKPWACITDICATRAFCCSISFSIFSGSSSFDILSRISSRSFFCFSCISLAWNFKAYCYMTAIKDLLWLAETSFHNLWKLVSVNQRRSFIHQDLDVSQWWAKFSPSQVDIRIC